jgi:hypothetical protein
MTNKEFDKVDDGIAFVAYGVLVLATFLYIDYVNLLAINDLTEFGREWTSVIAFAGFAVFAILQSLRLVAHKRRYGKGL